MLRHEILKSCNFSKLFKAFKICKALKAFGKTKILNKLKQLDIFYFKIQHHEQAIQIVQTGFFFCL
jgi:hypothetical protein